jgi:hypothetical protein
MRHMAGGSVLGSRLTVAFLVVEKDICPESLEEFTLVDAAQEDRFVNADAPVTKRADDTFVRRR